MENIIGQPTYLFLDTELGGLEKEHSLLSAYFLITDENFNKIDDLELFTKPDNNNYIVCGDAMNVNRIDLKVHDRLAITYKEAGTKLYNWLRKLSNDGQIKFVVVGHSITGDRDKICQCLINRGSWEKFTSYRLLCTQSTTQFLKACGLFPDEVSGGLESVCKYFGIKFDQNEAHTSKYDTEKTMALFLALRGMITTLKKS